MLSLKWSVILRVSVVALALFGLSGCVYWRLNVFRNQLSDFTSHYKVESRERPTIVSLEPVLKPDDLGWLMGLTPTRTSPTNAVYHFQKMASETAAPESEGAYDLVFRAEFKEDLMVAFQFPTRFSKVMTQEIFSEAFKGMSDGSLERVQHATGWVWEDNVIKIPRYTNIVYYLGQPSEAIEQKGIMREARYHYRLQGTNKVWNPTGWDLYFHFIFEPEDVRLTASETYLGRLRINIMLQPQNNQIEIKRL
jgi:hypothetical protein